MARELRIKGNTPEEKFASIEVILRRMFRRLSSKVIGIVPVSPIFDFAYEPDNEGVVMRRLFPSSGRITQGAIAFDSKGSKPVKLSISIDNDLKMRSLTSSYPIKKIATTLDLDFEILAGDKITIKVEPDEVDKEKGEKIKGVWIGFAFEANLKSLTKKDFLLEELERLISEEITEITE